MSLQDYEVKASKCPICREMLDRAMAPGRAPHPGDYTVCFGCLNLLVFGEEMVLREPTKGELFDIAGDPGFIALQAAMREAKTKE